MSVLVDRAVRQVRVHVVQLRLVVAISGEANKSLLIEVDLHWPQLSDRGVYTHIPLATTYEHRVRYVLLEYALLSILEIVHLIDNGYANSTSAIGGFANPHGLLVSILVPVVDDLLVLVRQNES